MLNGGLGNQLFQYAIARKLALTKDTYVVLDTSLYNHDILRKFSLQHFNIQHRKLKKQHYYLFKKQASTFIVERLYYKILRQLKKPITYIESLLTYNAAVVSCKNNTIYLEGYWQTEKYFTDIRTQLLQDLTVTIPLAAQNLEMANAILQTNSVALHIRRGDYVANAHTLSIHGVCGLDYYKRAINYITTHTIEPELFVFSDDMEWVKQNLKTNLPLHFVTCNNATTDYEDLRLMSLCQHNIIANSSFSWWGAWLNVNADKIVIAPQQWFATTELNATDIVPNNWIKL